MNRYGDAMDFLKSVGSAVISAAPALAGAALKPFFEELKEVTEPAELAGAKLSKAFKIRKDGNNYFVEINASVEGIPAAITSIAGKFTGVKLTDPMAAQEIDFQGLGKIKYEPPPAGKSTLYLILGGAVLALVVAYFVFGKK